MPQKRKPLEIRELEGNPGKRPIPARADDSGLARSTGHTPAELKRDADAAIAWRRLWQARLELGLEARIYDPAGLALCRAYSGMRGGSEQSAREFRYWLNEFGLTPAARARLGGDAPQPPGADPLRALDEPE